MRRGYTLLEVLMALIILTITLVPLGYVLGDLGRWNAAGRDRDEALQIGRETWGQILSIPADSLRDSSWTVKRGTREFSVHRDVADSADVLRLFPDAKLDGKGRPKALSGPVEYALTVARGTDTFYTFHGLLGRESQR
jgi:prepilin-type N-terminal cleavage/methylation domain-containing protein